MINVVTRYGRRKNLPCGFVNSQVAFTPGATFAGSMLSRLPLSFPVSFDSGESTTKWVDDG